MNDYEQIKLTSARQVYRYGASNRVQYWQQGKNIKRKYTWAEWWSDKFGEDYYEYVERMKK